MSNLQIFWIKALFVVKWNLVIKLHSSNIRLYVLVETTWSKSCSELVGIFRFNPGIRNRPSAWSELSELAWSTNLRCRASALSAPRSLPNLNSCHWFQPQLEAFIARSRQILITSIYLMHILSRFIKDLKIRELVSLSWGGSWGWIVCNVPYDFTQ